MSDVVAVEQIGVGAQAVQLGLHQIGDGRLARSRQPGEPDHGRSMARADCASCFVHLDLLPVDVVGSAQCEVEHSGTHRVLGDPVDDDESAGLTLIGIGVEGHRTIGSQIADPDFVQFEGGRREVLEGVDVDAVLGLADRHADGLRPDAHEIGTAGKHRILVHPDEMGLELVRETRRGVRTADQIATTGVHIVGEHHGHRLSGDGQIEITVHGDDPIDGSADSRWQNPDLVTR